MVAGETEEIVDVIFGSNTQEYKEKYIYKAMLQTPVER